ncbi:hypothetical protein [Kitasatospora sp. NPDC088346]|uniref:hypothetical protein n=1 Tax=Kitasatospora sp. NPDC088346 TaxID=3364073 RepID=UPI00382DB274
MDALLAHGADEAAGFASDLVAAAEEITAEAAAATDTVLKRTTLLPADPEPVPGRHVTQAASNPGQTTWEQDQVKAWSPWRNGLRWSETRRAVSGPRPVRD